VRDSPSGDVTIIMLLTSSLRRASAAALLLAWSATGAWAQAGDAAGFPFGVWQNPRDTVHIDIRPCGAAACGYVVWASPKAEADVQRRGGQPLLGSQLFKDFTPIGKDVWRGKVFVPDMRMTFSGAASPVDTTGLKARGCLIGNYLCRSQVWRRIG
jgi:uncharacterized protein (DUF2147 family)